MLTMNLVCQWNKYITITHYLILTCHKIYRPLSSIRNYSRTVAYGFEPWVDYYCRPVVYLQFSTIVNRCDHKYFNRYYDYYHIHHDYNRSKVSCSKH